MRTMQSKRSRVAILILLLAPAGNPTIAADVHTRNDGRSESFARTGTQSATGIPQCDDYYAAVAACLPQMCEAERVLAEVELSFNREILSKVIELKGGAAAAEACAQDLLKEIQADPYGCYQPQRAKAGLPKGWIEDLRVLPAATGVTLSFKLGPQASSNGQSEVAIVSEDLQNEVRYLLAASNGVFTLNTAVDRPAAAPGESGSFSLEPQSSYCFAIKSADGDERRGSFTTSASH
jgi:hypothetical protein